MLCKLQFRDSWAIIPVVLLISFVRISAKNALVDMRQNAPLSIIYFSVGRTPPDFPQGSRPVPVLCRNAVMKHPVQLDPEPQSKNLGFVCAPG